jgi:hypothetical protein
MKPASSSKLRIDETPERLRIRWRTGAVGLGCFFLFWMTGWSFGCALITNLALHEPTFLNLAGAAVFDAAWLFGFVMLANQFLGRETITLDADGLTHVKWTIFRRRCTVPIADIFGFTTECESIDDAQRRGAGNQLEVRTAGRPLRAGGGLTHNDVLELAATLRKYHARLPTKRLRDSAWPPERERIVFRPRPGGETDGAPLRSPQDPPIEPPGDTRMRRRDGFDYVRFSTRGRFTLGGAIAALLFNVFWNGITGVFVFNLFWGGPQDKPQGVDWYEQFLFLLPFELIGLAFFLGFLLVLFEPFRVWSHRFGTSDVRDRLTWFGVGWRKRYDLGLVDRLEVRRAAYSIARLPKKRLNLATLWTPPGCPTYSLVVVEMGNRDVCELQGFTFGEACWAADVLVRRSDFPWAG